MSFSRLILPALFALSAVAAPALAQPAAPQASANKPSKGEQQALKWFAMLDADKDGRISREEAKVATRIRPSLADYFREADLNGDGYVTQQEIRTVADRRRAERQARRQREAEQAAAASPAAQATPKAKTQAPARSAKPERRQNL